jgi:hypothetical protein
MSAHKIRSACRPFLIIVHGHTLVLRANAKKVFLTNRPQQWLALYGYLRWLTNCELRLQSAQVGRKPTSQTQIWLILNKMVKLKKIGPERC